MDKACRNGLRRLCSEYMDSTVQSGVSAGRRCLLSRHGAERFGGRRDNGQVTIPGGACGEWVRSSNPLRAKAYPSLPPSALFVNAHGGGRILPNEPVPTRRASAAQPFCPLNGVHALGLLPALIETTGFAERCLDRR